MRLLLTLSLLLGFCSFARGQSTCALPEVAAAEALDQPAALLALPSEQFFQQLVTFTATKHPPDELWPLFERCLREHAFQLSEDEAESPFEEMVEPTRAWQREFACATLATDLARQGTSSDLAALWSTFDELPDAHTLRGAIVGGVLSSRLSQAAAQALPAAARVAAGGPDLILPPVPSRASRFLEERPEPSWLTGATTELRDAWRTVGAARHAYLRATQALAGEEPMSFQSHGGAFFETIADYLRGRLSPVEATLRIGRFDWGSWCGTGAGVFDEPRDRALLLAFVELGRFDLAVAPLLNVASDERSGAGVDWRGLATRLGLDWEQLALGSFLQGDSSAATALAAHGSEQAARNLLSALTVPAPYGDAEELLGHSQQAIASIAALVTPGGSCGDDATFHSVDVERQASELPDDVQSSALSALSALVGDESGLDEASEAARQLQRLCRPESLPGFVLMARSPYSSARVLGAQALKALGASASAAQPAAPVIFRLRVDGVPWQGPLQSTVLSAGRASSETLSADASGVLSFDRDPFVDRRAPVLAVRLTASALAQEASTWFQVQEPAPHDLDTPVEARVETRAVTVVLPLEHAGACADGSCRISLEAELTPDWLPLPSGAEAEDYRRFESIAEERSLRAGVLWTVRLAVGFRYRAVVTSAGGRWMTPVVEPGGEPVTLVLRGDTARLLEP